MKKLILIGTATAMIATGCATAKENPNTAKGAGIGAAIGAVAGAVIGHQTGRRNEGALIGAAIGAGIGGVGSFAALYGLGSVVGFSAAGITSGLAAAGSIVGGGMVAGVFVLAAPVAALAAGGVGLASHFKNKQLRQEKERLYKEALKKHEAIIQALKYEANADKERLDYLQSLNILLK